MVCIQPLLKVFALLGDIYFSLGDALLLTVPAGAGVISDTFIVNILPRVWVGSLQ